jgi:hypothetical protein
MSTLLISQLREALLQLQAQSRSTYTALDKQRLQLLLTTTINTLRTLYPDHFNHAQRFQLLQNLMVLEQQSFTIGPVEDAALITNLAMWRQVHESLIVSIETTLADKSNASD